MEPTEAIRWLMASPDLRAGLLCGLVAAAVVVALAGHPALRKRRPIPVAGAATAVATLVALHRTTGVPGALLAGFIATLGAGTWIGWRRPPTATWPLLYLPGALLVVSAWSGRPEIVWARVLGVLTIAVGGALTSAFAAADENAAVSPGLALGTAIGVFLTVPDTEQALALMGAAVPIAVTGWPLRWARFGVAGSAAWVAVMVWATLTGGVGRDASILGGLACLGVFAFVPVVRGVAGRRTAQPRRQGSTSRTPATHAGSFSAGPFPATWRSVTSLVATHAAYVLVASRAAGLRQSPTQAAAILLAATAALIPWLWYEHRH